MSFITFGYQDDKYVYKDMDFYARSGEIVALLGASGGGKSTLMRVMLGMLEPDSGSVIVEDKNGNQVPVNSDLRYFFAYVPQGNTILSGSIAENMRMVREDVSDAEIIEALKTACAWEFVSKIPDGINGTLGEHGRGISEGQAQRLSIARALIRNAPIMLLDEATSALDSDTEKQVLNNIIKRYPNKLIIVSTHRLGVLNLCDRICRIVDGKIKELDNIEAEQIISEGILSEFYAGQDNGREQERRVVDQMINEAHERSTAQDASVDNNLPDSKGWWNI